MIPLKIENWEINHKGIEWKGKTGRELIIDTDRITEFGFGEREKIYDWLIHLTEKSWLTRNDIYALNSAFIYAVLHFKLDLDSKSFIQTIIMQKEQLDLLEDLANYDEKC